MKQMFLEDGAKQGIRIAHLMLQQVVQKLNPDTRLSDLLDAC
jgi:hypothetical protein